MVLDTIQRKPALAIIKGCGDGTQQPVFQEANTADAALIEIEPVICDPPFGWAFQRHASQQFEEGTLELNAILLSLQLVAGKVDWQATACRLPTEFAEIEEIIGSYQNIEHACLAAQ